MASKSPLRNKRYRPKARAALAAAKSNLRVARLAASEGEMSQAAAGLVDAGEEVAKAFLYNAAYEDVITFDYRRAGERIFLFGEARLKEHDPKQGSLVGMVVAFWMAEISIRLSSLPEPERSKIQQNPVSWMRREWPGYDAILGSSKQLEELRQARHSGTAKSGRRAPTLSRREFTRLAAGIDSLVGFSEYEQRTFRWGKGELAAVQSALPKVVKEVNPIVEKAKRQAKAQQERKKRRRECVAARPRIPPSPSSESAP